MEELVKTFHIDWKLLIAQMINFLIVFSVLYFFALKPLMKLMKSRGQRIENGLKNAEEIEAQLKDLEKQKQETLNQAKKEASLIIVNIEVEAEKVRREKIEKTREEAERVVKDAKLEINNERTKMMQEVKSELGNLVLLASDKLTSQTIDRKKHAKLIDQMIEELKNTKLE
jgi:F-type H+-transporting ATPase subunit b